MIILLKLATLYVFGFLLVENIHFKGEWYEKLGLAFLLSTGVISILYFLFIWQTNHVESGEFWFILIILNIVLYLLHRPKVKYKKINLREIFTKSNIIVIVCWLAIIFLFACSLVNTFYLPVNTSDSIALFDFRTKIMFLSHKLSDIQTIDGWNSYPMFTSMAGLIGRFLGPEYYGSFYVFMYFSFTLVFYSRLRKTLDKNLASIGTLLMYTTPITLWQSHLNGLTNLSYTIFLSLSILYLYSAFFSRQFLQSDIILSAIFLGLSSWTRGIEPFWTMPIFAITLYLLSKKKIGWLLLYYSIFYSIREIWPIYIKIRYISIATGTQLVVASMLKDNIIAPNGLAISHPFYSAFVYTFKTTFTLLPQSIGYACFLFVIIFLIDLVFGTLSKKQVYFLFMIFGFLAILIFGAVYMVINFHIKINIYNDSYSRLLSTIIPLLWFYIMLSPYWKNLGKFFKSI
jgi:hypothetical protein